jgi:3-oxoacyl-[acyl-carrier protein] reductase
MSDRPVVLLTGLGRQVGIAAGIAERLAKDGWNIAFVYSAEYDESVNGGTGDIAAIEATLHNLGAKTVAIDADLGEVDAPADAFRRASALGDIQALVLSHAHSTNAGITAETVENFDRHFAVNTRASWLLIREFGLRFRGEPGSGRIVALTSDALVDEIAYGASKAALDRIVFAAASELTGITANLVNPGPIDTGCMTPEVRDWAISETPAGRLGTPADTASLISFLLSEQGSWIDGQLLKSDGGFSALR